MYRFTTAVSVAIFLVFSVTTTVSQATDNGEESEGQEATTQEQLERSYEQGLSFFMESYDEEAGAFVGFRGEPDVAFTAFAVQILTGAPPEYAEQYQEELQQSVEYILDAQQENGEIIDAGKTPRMSTYKSSLGVMALVEAREAYPIWNRTRFREPILSGRSFLVDTQFSNSFQDIGPDHWAYGGFDYNYREDEVEPDMSNTQFAIEALERADLPEDHPAWDRAVTFLQRSQNFSETNDLETYFEEQGLTIGNDGGFMYHPGLSYAGEKVSPSGGDPIARSYGSMTYAGLKSYIFANLDRDDSRVQAAYDWIRNHYQLDRNPGMAQPDDRDQGAQGLYYYYLTFAKAMDAWGETHIETPDGEAHHWARDLTSRLIDVQNENGSWVNEVTGRWGEDHPPLTTAYSLLALNITRDWVSRE